MKVLVPFSPAKPGAAALPVIGTGELADNTGRHFQLLDDRDGRRLILHAHGAREITYDGLMQAFAGNAANDQESVPGLAAVDLAEETRPDAPALVNLDGDLHRAVNGWAIVRVQSEGRPTLNLPVIAMATAVANAPLPASKAAPVPPKPARPRRKK